jgi:hypothetical protein
MTSTATSEAAVTTAEASVPFEEPEAEYILVADKTSEILSSVLGWKNAGDMRKTASIIRKAGGEVTIFKATKY